MPYTVLGIATDGTKERIGSLHERWESAKAQLDELVEVGEGNAWDGLELSKIA